MCRAPWSCYPLTQRLPCAHRRELPCPRQFEQPDRRLGYAQSIGDKRRSYPSNKLRKCLRHEMRAALLLFVACARAAPTKRWHRRFFVERVVGQQITHAETEPNCCARHASMALWTSSSRRCPATREGHFPISAWRPTISRETLRLQGKFEGSQTRGT